MRYKVTVCPEIWVNIYVEASSPEEAGEKASAIVWTSSLHDLMSKHLVSDELIIGDHILYKAEWDDGEYICTRYYDDEVSQ